MFVWSTLQNYMGMKQRGGTDEARRNRRLVIGPWTHASSCGSFLEREFGRGASSTAIDLPGIHLCWFDRWLKGVDTGVDQVPLAMIFVMGVDEWRHEADWLLPDTQYHPYYLHSRGGANTLHSDGALSTDPPSDEPSDVYLHYPLRPVPTVGGQVISPGANAMGPQDQREVESRGNLWCPSEQWRWLIPFI